MFFENILQKYREFRENFDVIQYTDIFTLCFRYRRLIN